jgi:serine/threonine protein kinase
MRVAEPDLVFGGRYAIRSQINEGSFGKIYKGCDIQTGEIVAIKVEELAAALPQLRTEFELYSCLSGSVNVAQLHFYGVETRTCALVIDFLGKSLENLIIQCGCFSPKTVLMLADQMISALEYFHSTGYVHCDVKPENFMMGCGQRYANAFIIDFGLARRYRTASGSHIPFSEKCDFSGTPIFASVSSLRENAVSRRDDMEALAYVWLYLLTGSLPWMAIRGTPAEQRSRLCVAKLRISPEKMFQGQPKVFAEYLQMVRKLRFMDTPQYALYRRMFREALLGMKFVYDYKYDWVATGPRLVPSRSQGSVRLGLAHKAVLV